MPKGNKEISGFTLVELAIVLVIIGLLVGGILVGKYLISASEIRAQISQIEELKTAINTFKLKTGYLPADIPPRETAQLGFFTYKGTYAGSEKPDPAMQKFCGYGNNDNRITRSESFVFWRHLSEAKLIKGEYGANRTLPFYGLVGISNTASTSATCLDGNIVGNPPSGLGVMLSGRYNEGFAPKAKINSNYYIDVRPVISYYDTSNIQHAEIYNTSLNNFFVFFINQINQATADKIITANQAYSIDTKIDDGLPVTGAVREWLSDYNGDSSPPCTTGTYPNLSYNVAPATADTQSCATAFLW